MQKTCKSCRSSGIGTYCFNCGQNYDTKRITVSGILHEVFHFFTHLDKGFPFTLKKLISSPGRMQLQYVEGVRNRHQKPFSMFFISATLNALAIYWINQALIKYFNAGEPAEAAFFQSYWVLLQTFMLPVYAFITWIIFKNSKLNYAEIVVLQLYTFSMMFLLITAIHLLKFMFPHLQTRYIELPVLLFYCMATNLAFFNKLPKWLVAVQTVAVMIVCFFLANFIQDSLVRLFN